MHTNTRFSPLFGMALGLAMLCGCQDASKLGASSDPETQLREILAMPAALSRAAALADFLESAEPRDLAAVERAIDHARGDMDEVSGALIASWWASFDPATAYTNELGAAMTGRKLWERTVLREWAHHEPEAVLEVVKQLPETDHERLVDASQALMVGWFEREETRSRSLELLPVLESLPLGRTRNEAIDSFLSAMADHAGIETTIEFVEALPGDGYGNFKLQFYRRLATAVAQRDPQRAIAWAQKHTAGPYGTNLLRRVGARWGWVDGEPAMEWALTLPESEARAGIVRETYRGFRMRARERADTWMRAQEPSTVLEPAYGIFLIGISRDKPREALALIENIQDQELRDGLIVSVGRRWMRNEPKEARVWLSDATLSAELKAKIQDPKLGAS